MNLENYRVANLPSKCYIIEDFITCEEENYLLKNIYHAPLTKWTCLRGRRLQNWGGVPHSNGMIIEDIPEWLRKFMDKVAQLGFYGDYKPNHVLINEYEAGQGIFPHHDGSLYHPVVVTINLNAYGILDFYHPFSDSNISENFTSFKNRYIGSVYLKPRSLNVVTDKLYNHYMHGISFRETDVFLSPETADKNSLSDNESIMMNMCDFSAYEGIQKREKRISVTIRYVPKTLKVNMKKLFGLN